MSDEMRTYFELVEAREKIQKLEAALGSARKLISEQVDSISEIQWLQDNEELLRGINE